MLASWVFPSLVAFLSTVVAILCYRKLQLRGVPLTIQTIGTFIIPFLGFLFWIFYEPQYLKVDFDSLLKLTITSVIFIQVGTILTIKAISLSNNPGYPVAITRTNVLITALVSVILFNSPLTWIKFLAILIIFFFSLLILDFSNKSSHSKNVWFWYALLAGVLTSGYALSSKYFINEGIPILTRLFYAFAAMAFVQGLNLVIKKPKVNLFKIDYVLLFIIGVSTFIFDIFAQIGFQYAPNPGYVNAILTTSIVPTTFFSAVFFKDELNLKKIIGLIGVMIGLYLVIF